MSRAFVDVVARVADYGGVTDQRDAPAARSLASASIQCRGTAPASRRGGPHRRLRRRRPQGRSRCGRPIGGRRGGSGTRPCNRPAGDRTLLRCQQLAVQRRLGRRQTETGRSKRHSGSRCWRTPSAPSIDPERRCAVSTSRRVGAAGPGPARLGPCLLRRWLGGTGGAPTEIPCNACTSITAAARFDGCAPAPGRGPGSGAGGKRGSAPRRTRRGLGSAPAASSARLWHGRCRPGSRFNGAVRPQGAGGMAWFCTR